MLLISFTVQLQLLFPLLLEMMDIMFLNFIYQYNFRTLCKFDLDFTLMKFRIINDVHNLLGQLPIKVKLLTGDLTKI